MVFVPENKLEVSLAKAATDPAQWAQFYRNLVESDLFVIDEGPPPERSGRRTAQAGEQLQLRNMVVDGELRLPVFSSLLRLQAALTEPGGYLALNALALMEMTKGTPLVLNPGSDYGKVFTNAEIASILDGSLWRPDSRYQAEEETEVRIGQPAVYPQELVDVLIRVFKRLRTVHCAYLAHFFNPAVDKQAHTLIGLEVTGDWDAVMAEVMVAARGVTVPNPPVDFLQLTGSREGVQGYFHSDCEPFYRAKKLRLF
jgi:hypothetical protein